MVKEQKGLQIKIPEKAIVEETGRLSDFAGEGAVRAYILKNPYEINEDLTCAQLKPYGQSL